MNKPRKTFSRRRTILFFTCLLIVFIIIQFIRPEIKNPPVTGDLQAPVEVKTILKQACYDCHSNETQLRWFDQISPVNWRVAQHVKDGRKVLNFSEWGSLAAPDQKAKLWEAVNQIQEGAMPLKDYEMVHSSAKVSANQLNILKSYLQGMVKPATYNDTAKTNAADKQYKKWQDNKLSPDNLPVALNGITYIPDYKNWQALSTSERFDNNTLRVIFGNDIAVKAVKENKISPWPNGTIFAKVAWAQVVDKDGTIHTGAFLQVEYMIKDDKKYASTGGWGFARFKTPKMVPYGKTPLFATECINCHRPMKNEDFVFTLPIKH
jgi:hypothetical protein